MMGDRIDQRTRRTTAQQITALTRQFQDWPPNATRDPEALTTLLLLKVMEEVGEASEAHFGVVNGNPRKAQQGFTVGDVLSELLDVATTALIAYEHIEGGHGACMEALAEHVGTRLARVLFTP